MTRHLGAGVYLWRNAGKTLPLTGVVLLAVMLVVSVVSLINSIPYSISTIYKCTSEFLIIGPRGDPSLDDEIIAKIRQHAPVPVERVCRCHSAGALVQSIVGKWPFSVFGLTRSDLRYALQRQGATRLEGRLPNQGEPAVVVSEPVARNLHLKIGSALLKPDDVDNYSPHVVRVVGIAQTDRWLMLADIQYMRANHFPPIDFVIAYAKSRADQPRLDAWAMKEFTGKRASVFTYERLEKDTNHMFQILYGILDVVIAVLVLVVTIMMGMQINIYQTQRLIEFGLLQALGYTRAKLISRVLKETLTVLLLGWGLGVAASYSVLVAAKHLLMDPHAFALDIMDPMAYRYTVPIPVAILLVAVLTVWLRFRRFDPVGIVERRLV